MLAGLLSGLAIPVLAQQQATVAVAANFSVPARALVPVFEAQSGHTLRLATGSSGKLFAQVVQGAPFDVLLSADQEIPARLVEQGLADEDSVFTYARGRLILWSAQASVFFDEQASESQAPGVLLRIGEPILPDPGLVEFSDIARAARSSQIRRLALANPRLAPYGRAAEQVLRHLELAEPLAGRLVYGENISQALQFVVSGNAQAGFLSLSLLSQSGVLTSGNGVLIPASLHEPILQDAVLLNRGRGNEAALAFLRFLRSPAIQERLQEFGYARGRCPDTDGFDSSEDLECP